MLAIVHISDIHFKSDFGRERAAALGAHVAAAAVSQIGVIEEVLIVATGDIAYSGLHAEYQIASGFFHGISEEVRGRRNGRVPIFAIAPGNHDCDHSVASTARQALIESPKFTDPDDASIDLCLEVQKHFRAFRSNLSLRLVQLERATSLLERAVFKAGTLKLCVQVVNTAWASQKDDRYGHLRMPESKLTEHASENDTDVLISILHHPYSWFEQNHLRHLRRYIESSSDIVLTGHEHYADVSMVSRRGGIRAQYVEGGVLAGLGDGETSSFNVLLIDDSGKRFRCKTYVDDGTGQYVEASDSEWHEYVRNAGRLKMEFELADTYCEYLSGVGAQYTHPHKAKLELGDIYVPPTLREKNIDDGEDREAELYPDPAGLAGSKRHLLIIGAEKSGKTALAKYLVKEMHARGKVPLLIKASKHDPSRKLEEYLDKAFRQLFEGQYGSKRLTEFLQLEPSKRVVIVDDYHKLRLNEAGRNFFLQIVEQFADTVILTAGEEYDYQDISDLDGSHHSIMDYHCAEILPFGNVLRGRLIEKWYTLGADYASDKKALERAMVEAERTVRMLLNSNVIPPFPIFVLIVLQQLEANRAPSTESGSMGYLYEYLITESMAQDKFAKVPLDQKYTYLSVLAKWMYDNRVSAMTEAQHTAFHDLYRAEYGVAIRGEQVVGELLKARILETSPSGLRFKYKYIRFYFTGRYLAENLDDPKSRELVEHLSQRLYREDASNIILFLCYLSKNRFVLDTILTSTQQSFVGVNQFSYDSDGNAFRELMDKTPKFVMDGTTAERRAKAQELQDKEETYDVGRARDSVEVQDDELTEDLAEVSDMAKINAAFKSMQILGQIVRNSGGALKAERKEEVVRECVALGLRVGSWYSNLIKRGGREFVEMLVGHFLKHDPHAQAAEIESEVKSFLFVCLERTLFVITKKISDSIGLQMLLPTIEKVLDVKDSSAEALIDLSVRLDHAEQLPHTQAIKLYQSAKKDKKNLLLETLVRHIVWHHLYLYPVPYQAMQRICDALKIKKGSRLLKPQTKIVEARDKNKAK